MASQLLSAGLAVDTPAGLTLVVFLLSTAAIIFRPYLHRIPLFFPEGLGYDSQSPPVAFFLRRLAFPGSCCCEDLRGIGLEFLIMLP